MSEDRAPNVDRWHTIAQVATMLGVSDKSIRRRLAEFGAVRVGRAFRVSDAGIRQFVEAHTVKKPERPIRLRDAPLSKMERLRSARELRDRAIGLAR